MKWFIIGIYINAFSAAKLTMIVPPQPVLGRIMEVRYNQITACFTLRGRVESGHWSPFIGIKATTKQWPWFFWFQKSKKNIVYTMLRYQKGPGLVTAHHLLRQVHHVWIHATSLLQSCWLRWHGHKTNTWWVFETKAFLQTFLFFTCIPSPNDTPIDLHSQHCSSLLVSLLILLLAPLVLLWFGELWELTN